MSAPSSGISPDLQELMRNVHDLEQRVLRIEERLPQPVAESATPAPEAPAGTLVPPNALPVIGRALLAVAGAYVLRALTDLGVLTPAVGVSAGLVYALAWLFVAARLPAAAKFAMLLGSLTSVAIMAPLLWEACIRLNAISSPATAAVLVGFALAGIALAWGKRLGVIAGVASAASAVMAAVLLLATRDLFPYALALLAVAAALEFAAWTGRRSGSRWLVALLADCAVLLLSWIVTRPQGIPEGYAAAGAWSALTAQLLLIAIFGVSAIIQTLVLRRTFTPFETLQTAASALIGISGLSWDAKGSPEGLLALGLSALLAGAGCYVVSFLIVPAENKWNFRAWATFGLLLVLSGSFLPSAGAASWVLWCGCAVICSWAAMAARKPTLGLHGAAYIVLAAIASGAASGAALQIFGAAGTASWSAPALVFTSALLAWIAIDRGPAGESAVWRRNVASFLVAAVMAWIAAGAAAHLLVRLWPAPSGVPADTLATVVLATLVVAIGWSGAHWGRRELRWVVYALMALAVWKLAIRDVPHERNLSLVVSLLFYGGALIILPRFVQKKATAAR
jgi:hypothetical protein